MQIEQQTLESNPNFPTEIGFYISGMEEVREQLRKAVKGLSDEEVAAKLTPNTHSIGQLILHNAEAEWWWLKCVVAEKELDEEEAKREAHWGVLLDEDFASKNYSAEFCIEEVDRVRKTCLEVLKGFSDDVLEKYFGWDKDDGIRVEKSLRWILHHLIDHEAQHKGQMLMLKRLLKDTE